MVDWTTFSWRRVQSRYGVVVFCDKWTILGLEGDYETGGHDNYFFVIFLTLSQVHFCDNNFKVGQYAFFNIILNWLCKVVLSLQRRCSGSIMQQLRDQSPPLRLSVII
jgi:hypothetical protein